MKWVNIQKIVKLETVKVKLDLSNYTTKSDIEKATGVDISEFAKMADLVSLKWNVDRWDFDELKTVKVKEIQTDFKKLSGNVDKDDVKKMYTIYHCHVPSPCIKQNQFWLKKKPTDLTKKVLQISRKGYNCLLGRMYFKGDDGYQIFIVFPPMYSLLTLDSNENITNWISIGISPKKFKPFGSSVAWTMSCLANREVSIKFNNSILVQQNYCSFYSNFMLNLCIVYQLSNLSCNKFTLNFFI